MDQQVRELPSLKELVKESEVTFSHFRQENFYYNLGYRTGTMDGQILKDGGIALFEKIIVYQFPIPLEELGNATLEKTEKAITTMRWIRKAIAEGTFVEII